MRLLVLIFLFGFAASYPYGSSKEASDEDLLAFMLDMEDAMEMPYAEDSDEDPKTELGKKLREHLDHILEKIKEAMEEGVEIKDDLIEQAKELREKLKNLKIDVGNKAKEILEKIKEKAKDWLKEILEKLGLKESSDTYDEFRYMEFDEEDPKTELGKKLREQLDGILEHIKEAMEKGRAVKEDLIEKAKEIREKLKDMKMDIGDKAKELLEKLKDKAKDWLNKLLEKLGMKEFSDTYDEFGYMEFDEEDPKTELGKKLREHLDNILEHIKEEIEKGKAVKEELISKAKEIREKLKDLKIDIGNKAKEILEKIKEKAKDWLKKILEKLGLKESSDTYDEFRYMEFDEEDPKTELGKKLKEHLDDVLEKIKVAMEKGKAVKEEFLEKAKEIRQKLKDLKMDIGDKARELLDKIKEKTKDWLQKMLEKWGLREEFSDTYEDINLRAVLSDILDKIESQKSNEDIADCIKEGLRDSPLGEALLQKLQQGRKPLKHLIETLLRLTSRDSRSIKDIYEKIKDYLKDLHQDFKDKYANFLDWVKDVYSKGKDAAKDRISNIKDVAREFIDHAKKVKKEVAEEALEFFRPYKHDLGKLWEDIKKKAKDAIGH